MIPPCAFSMGTATSTVGVVDNPKSMTLMPKPCRVLVTKSEIICPEIRASRPITIIGFLLIEIISDIAIKIMALSIVTWIFYKAIIRMLNREDITGQAIGEMNEKYWSIGVFFGGMSSGLLGIGGGGIFVTTNRNYGGFDTKSSSGTSFMLAAMVVPTAIISHIIIDGTASEIYTQATIYALAIPFLVTILSFSGAKYAINYLPVKFITSLFIMIISLSMIKYTQEIISILI